MSECVYILFLPVSPFSSRVAIVSLEIIIGPFVVSQSKVKLGVVSVEDLS